MSNVIDRKVVEMQFDNKDFEKNVSTTMSTLDRLKAKFDFSGQEKVFSDLEKASGKVSFGGLGEAIEGISVKFSALQVAAFSVLNNIVSKAVDAGTQFVNSLGIDQITAGWSKYEMKTTAVQTIMAATRQQIGDKFKDEAEQMEYVNEQLQRLNWFTDETSYNFVDMTSNIGKFTSAGVDLDVAVTAMQGIAAEAAISGQNAQAASRAMYNLSQAMGSGYVMLKDWMSIENANMATKEFKETLIQVAEEMDVIEKGAVTAEGFRDTLKDKWLTADVLTKALDKYGAFSVELAKVMEEVQNDDFTTSAFVRFVNEYKEGTLDIENASKETGMEIERLQEIFENFADPKYELGIRAFTAAQEAKTLTEAIDSVKDAVSTGWMNTFELIFGNYQEAKKLWTDLAEELYSIFAAGGDARNDMLKEWAVMETGGRDDLIESLQNILDLYKQIKNTISEAWEELFPSKGAQGLADMVSGFKKWTESIKLSESQLDKLKRSVKGVFAIFKTFTLVIGAIFKPLKQFTTGMEGAGDGILDVTAAWGDWLVGVADYLEQNEVFENTIGKLIEWVAIAFNWVKDHVIGFFENPKVQGIITGIKDAAVTSWTTMKESFETAGDKLKEFFAKFDEAEGLGGKVQVIVDVVKEKWDGLISYLDGLNPFKKPNEEIDTTTKKLDEMSAKTDTSGGSVVDSIKKFFSDVGNALNGQGEELQKTFDGIDDKIFGEEGFFNKIKNKLSELTPEDFTSAAMGIFSVFLGAKVFSVVEGIGGIGNGFKKFGKSLKDITTVLKSQKASISPFTAFAQAILLIATGLAMLALVAKEHDLGQAGVAMTGIAVGLAAFAAIMSVISTKFPRQDRMANLILSIGESVLMLTTSIFILAQLPQDKMMNAMDNVLTLMITMTVLMGLVGFVNKNEKGTKTAMPGLASFIGLAIALLALIKVLKDLSEISPDKLVVPIVGVIAIILALSKCVKTSENRIFDSKIGNKAKIKNSTSSWGPLAAALACLILVKVVKSLADMPLADLVKSALLMVGLIGALSIIMRLGTAAGKDSDKGVMGQLFALAGVVAGLAIILGVFANFSAADSDKTLAAAESMTMMMIALTVMKAVISKWGGKEFKKGVVSDLFALEGVLVGMIAVLWAIEGMLTAMEAMGINNDATKVLETIGMISILLAVLSTMYIALNSFDKGENNIKVGESGTISNLFALEGIMLAMAGVLLAINAVASKMSDGGKVLATVGALVILISALTVLYEVLNKLDRGDENIQIGESGIISNLVVLEIIMLIMVGVVAVINEVAKGVDNTATLLGTVGALVALAAGLAVFYEIINNFGQKGNNVDAGVILPLMGCVVVIYMCQLVLGELAKIQEPLSKLEWETMGKLGAFVLALSVLTLIAGGIGKLFEKVSIGTILKGILLIGVVGIAVLAIYELIGAIEIISNGYASKTIEEANKIFEAIGEGIGKFAGGIVGGFAEGVAEKLEKAGESLANFWTSVQPLIEAVTDNTSMMTALDGVVKLSEAIIMLTAAEFISGITEFIRKLRGEDVGAFGERCAKLGEGYKKFAEAVEGAPILDNAHFVGLIAMLNIYNAVNNFESIISAWLGLNVSESMSETLGNFAKAYKEFCVEMITIPNVSQEKMDNLTKITDWFNATTSFGGFKAALEGEHDLERVGKQLSDFSESYITFTANIAQATAVTDDDITSCIKTLRLIGESPKFGGLAAFILGEPNMDRAGKQLADFSEGYVDFTDYMCKAKVVSDTTLQKIESVIGYVPTWNSLLTDTDAVRLGNIGLALKNIADAYKAMSDLTISNEFKRVNLGSMYDVLGDVGSLNLYIKNNRYSTDDLKSFGEGLDGLGEKFNDFYSIMAEGSVDWVEANSGISYIRDIIELAKSTKENDATTGLSNITAALVKMNEDINGFADKISGAKGVIEGTAVSLVGIFTTRFRQSFQSEAARINFSSAVTEITNFCLSLVTTLRDDMNNKETDIRKIGYDFMDIFVNGMNDKIEEYIHATILSDANQDTGIDKLMRGILGAINSIGTQGKGTILSMYDVGRNWIAGFIKGLNSKEDELTKKINSLSEDIITTMRKALRIESPSKESAWLGEMFGEGFSVGIDESSFKVFDSASGLGDSAMSGLQDSMSQMTDMLNSEDFQFSPEITPVLNLDEITSQMPDLENMLNDSFSSFDLTSSLANMFDTSKLTSILNNTEKNNKLMEQFKGIKDKLSNLGEQISGMQVVMDSGELVGSITNPINEALGTLGIQSRREKG